MSITMLKLNKKKLKGFVKRKPKTKTLLIQITIGLVCVGLILGSNFAYGKISDLQFDKKMSDIDLSGQAKIGQAKLEVMKTELNTVKTTQSNKIASLQTDLNSTNKTLEKQKTENAESTQKISELNKKVETLESQPAQIINNVGVEWAPITQKIMPYVVEVYTLNGSGSGIIISNKGQIITNAHVVNYDYDTIALIGISYSDKYAPAYKYFAYVSYISPDADIAILTIYYANTGYTLPSSFSFYDAPNNRASNVKMGDEIGILGYPGAGGSTITFTTGEVSGFDTDNGYSVVKTSAKLMPGNSGGIAFDKDGKIIGIPTYTRTSSTYSDSMGYILVF